MQKGRVGREEGEEAKMCLRGGREAVLTIGLPGNATTRQQRTHAGGRWHQGRASPSCKGGIRDITGIRGRDRAGNAM